jgi:nitrile hydratase accessory protein
MPDTVVTQPDVAEDPVFAEPWQAQAFAMTMQLSQRGAFTWGDWVEAFSTEIRTHPTQPGEDNTVAYYRQWLAALETILTARGLSTAEEISGTQELWRQAYLNTPHGLPVALENASLGCGADDEQFAHRHHDHGQHDDDHGHHHHVVGVRQPVAVSSAAIS